LIHFYKRFMEFCMLAETINLLKIMEHGIIC